MGQTSSGEQFGEDVMKSLLADHSCGTLILKTPVQSLHLHGAEPEIQITLSADQPTTKLTNLKTTQPQNYPSTELPAHKTTELQVHPTTQSQNIQALIPNLPRSLAETLYCVRPVSLRQL